MKFRLRLLLAAFAVSFLLVVALSVISFVSFTQLSNRVYAVEQSYRISNLIHQLGEQVRDLDRNEFRFLATSDSGYYHQYEEAAENVRVSTDSLKSLTADNTGQHNFIVLFNADMNLYLEASAKVIADSGLTHDLLHSPPYQRSKAMMETATGRLEAMAFNEFNLLQERLADRDSIRQSTASMIKALSIVFGILTLILFFLLLQEFRRRMQYQTELQQKVMEIDQSKEELEQIAYATSHDLQEPLRKIRILTDKWQHQLKAGASAADTDDTLGRVVAAASRMQDLVSDLMVLTSLHDGNTPEECPLNQPLQQSLTQLHGQIREKDAQIEVEELPVVNGYPEQLQLLFKNLLDNALKFSRPGVRPLIQITARLAGSEELGEELHTDLQYHCITIQDNGVGFDNKLADKMFGIFRQLHSVQEGFSGKGTGLAVCRRIMSNHKGRIIAYGFPDAGATFKLYFPALA